MTKTFLSGFIALATCLHLTTASFANGHPAQIQYSVGEKNFSAYLEKSTATSKGTIFIIHDWDELTDYEKSRAKMLSDMGYDAIAVDLFGIDAKLDSRDDFRRETGALYRNRDEFRKRISTAIVASLTGASSTALS